MGRKGFELVMVCNPEVNGSNPTLDINFFPLFQKVNVTLFYWNTAYHIM